MHVQRLGDVAVDVAQERQKLLMPVASLALGQHLAAGDVQGREQGGGSMPDVVVGDAFDIAQSHRQHRLSALQRLDLAFFVDAQHYGVIRRIQIQSDDVAHFLDEERVVGQFEGPLAVRLHAEQLEPARHGAFGDAAVLGHGTDRPVGGVGRGDCSAALMTSATRSSLWVRGRPGRSSSCNPSRPCVRKRRRHLPTVN